MILQAPNKICGTKLTQNCIFDNPTVTRGQLAMEPPQKSA